MCIRDSDNTPVALPYYNSANPARGYSGPNNTGVTQNTARVQRVALQLKAGTPAATGSQTTPTVDSGYVGLYVITVPYGATSITSADISTYPTAPFVGPLPNAVTQSSGTTAQRPSASYIGQPYFDTTLGYQINAKSLAPTVWVNATGVQV